MRLRIFLFIFLPAALLALPGRLAAQRFEPEDVQRADRTAELRAEVEDLCDPFCAGRAFEKIKKLIKKIR